MGDGLGARVADSQAGLRGTDRLPRRHVPAAAGGYLFDWRWTGYRNEDDGVPNQLWDWLTLLLQPIALLLIPLWLRAGTRRPGDWLVLGTAVAVTFVVLVLGGYLLDWTWTGFKGNTLWNWLSLFLMPFLPPLVLLLLLEEERAHVRRPTRHRRTDHGEASPGQQRRPRAPSWPQCWSQRASASAEETPGSPTAARGR